MKSTITILLFVALTAGCTNAVTVKKQVDKEVTKANGETINTKSFKPVAGLPFYVKKEVYDQETTYANTWLKVSLTVEKKLLNIKDATIKPYALDKQSFAKYLPKYNITDLDEIKASILAAGPLQNDDVGELVASFQKIPTLYDLSKVHAERIGNTVKSNWVVNESEKLYLNAPLPWFGSSNLTQELNPDGTLTKVVSAPDTKLAEGISSLIPLKEFLTGKFVTPLTEVPAGVVSELIEDPDASKSVPPSTGPDAFTLKANLVYIVTLSIIEEGYIYKFTKQHENYPSPLTPLLFETKSQLFTREVFSAKAKPAEKKAEGKSIGLTGTVSFPKDWGKAE